MDANGAALEQATVILSELIDKYDSPPAQPIVAEWYVVQALALGRSLLRTAVAGDYTTAEQFEAVRKRIRIQLIDEANHPEPA